VYVLDLPLLHFETRASQRRLSRTLRPYFGLLDPLPPVKLSVGMDEMSGQYFVRNLEPIHLYTFDRMPLRRLGD